MKSTGQCIFWAAFTPGFGGRRRPMRNVHKRRVAPRRQRVLHPVEMARFAPGQHDSSD